MNNWHSIPTDRLLEELDTRPQGLTAKQAKDRLDRYGPNALPAPKQASLLARVLAQVTDPMIVVLLAAAGLSLAVSGGKDWLDGAIILVIVVVNSVLSISQEDRAQQALEELQKLSSPMAQALRDGRQTRVQASDLVPGDIIYLEAGDLVPADARLLSSSRLQTDESAMTGESAPVEKDPDLILAPDAPLGDWVNMVLSGTLVTAGRGTAMVCATGRDSQMGHIAGMLSDQAEGTTPLQARMAEISQKLSFLCLCVCAVMFGLGLLQGKKMLDMFLTAVSLAVAAIPEGLPAIVTIVLALGVGRMAKRGAIVKKLPAVETLGCGCSPADTGGRPSPGARCAPTPGWSGGQVLLWPPATPPKGLYWWRRPRRGWTSTNWRRRCPGPTNCPLTPPANACPPSTPCRRGATGYM